MSASATDGDGVDRRVVAGRLPWSTMPGSRRLATRTRLIIAAAVVVLAGAAGLVYLLTNDDTAGDIARERLVTDIGLSPEVSECIVREADRVGVEPWKLDQLYEYGDGPTLSEQEAAALEQASQSCSAEIGVPVAPTPTLINLPAGPDPTQP